jgi:two-component system response regulator MprA
MREGHVLHVEDDEGLRNFVATALEREGFTLDTVSNGVDALRALHANPRRYDVVVLDLVLPFVNGLDVLAMMRAEAATRQLPVLVTTGTFVTPNEFAGDRFVSVLRKPFDDRQLVDAVGLTLHSARFGGAV